MVEETPIHTHTSYSSISVSAAYTQAGQRQVYSGEYTEQFILVLLLINHCTIYLVIISLLMIGLSPHEHCKPTFARPCM